MHIATFPINYLVSQSTKSNTRKNSPYQKSDPITYKSFFANSPSFGELNDTERGNFFQWLKDLREGLHTAKGIGLQGAFYPFGTNMGVKVPQPLHPSQAGADIKGHNNVKEHYILRRIYEIDPSIVPEPIDLITEGEKKYLITEIIMGIHPISSGLEESHLRDIIAKSFKLDIHGIVHTDLQRRNLILENNSDVKFIDFGAFNILTNNGYYIDTNGVPPHEFLDGGLIDRETIGNSREKFARTFFNPNQKYGIKNYSDNPHLNIRSSISNFEFRTLYEYFMNSNQEEPLDLFRNYLKIKAEIYHAKMIEYLTGLLNIFNGAANSQIYQAIEQEKVFKEVFSNPNDRVVATELGKIQLKWLANDFGTSQNSSPGISKVQSAFESFITMVQKYQKESQGDERKYFDGILSHFQNFLNLQNINRTVDLPLKDGEDILKKLHFV